MDFYLLMNRALGADGGYGIVLCNSCARHHHNLEGDILNPILRLPMTELEATHDYCVASHTSN